MGTTTRVVSRCGERLDVAALSTLLAAVQNDRNVTTLRLCHAGLTPSLVVQLADFLEQNATLTRVDLSDNTLDAHGASCLAASLAKNRAVTSLSLANCRLERASLTPWLAFFQAAAGEHTSKLTHIDLTNNDLDSDSVEQLAALIRTAQTPHLRLDVRKNALHCRDIRRLADALQVNHMIERLEFDAIQDDDNDGDAHSGGRIKTTALRLHKTIAFYLRRNAAVLQRHATATTISQIAHSALDVCVCHFVNVDLTIDVAELLARALRTNRSVTDLQLASNALPPEGVARIFRGLHGNTSVRRLAVLDNCVGDIGMRALALLLRVQGEVMRTPSLQSVSVANTVHLTVASGLVQPLTRRAASLLYHTFASYATVQRLTLANCGLSDFDVSVVVSGIAWRACVQDLDLRNNAFGDATVHVIAHMLHRCCRFVRLDLSGNRFTLQGLLPLVQAASAHPSIHTLLLGRVRSDAVSDTAAAAADATAVTPMTLVTTICATLQQSFSLAQVELHVMTATSTVGIARRDVAALNELLYARNGAQRISERDARALEDTVHAHRCRYRALVRQTAEQAVSTWCPS